MRTVIALLFNEEGKILILKRGSTAPWCPNMWSLVGGVIDKTDLSVIDALLREIKEETNLEVFYTHFLEEFSTEDIGTLIFYTGEVKGEVLLDYENSEYKFITKDEIEEFCFVPYTKDIILKYIK